MSQYEIVVRTEYRYVVDANNEHQAINIYLNDHDSCIPTNEGYLDISTKKVQNDRTT